MPGVEIETEVRYSKPGSGTEDFLSVQVKKISNWCKTMKPGRLLSAYSIASQDTGTLKTLSGPWIFKNF